MLCPRSQWTGLMLCPRSHVSPESSLCPRSQCPRSHLPAFTGIHSGPANRCVRSLHQCKSPVFLSAWSVSGKSSGAGAPTTPAIHAPASGVQFFAVHVVKLRAISNVVRNIVNRVVVAFAATKTLAPLKTDENQRENQQQQFPHGIPFPLI